MAPNTEATGRKGKVGMPGEEFLTICFKHLKAKPVIDWEGVGEETGMSTKGAQ